MRSGLVSLGTTSLISKRFSAFVVLKRKRKRIQLLGKSAPISGSYTQGPPVPTSAAPKRAAALAGTPTSRIGLAKSFWVVGAGHTRTVPPSGSVPRPRPLPSPKRLPPPPSFDAPLPPLPLPLPDPTPPSPPPPAPREKLPLPWLPHE